MVKRKDKRIFGMSRKKLLIVLTIGELLLCVVIIFGGYIIYNVSHPDAGASFKPPTVEPQSTPTSPVTPSPTPTATPNLTFTPTVTPGPLQIVSLDSLKSYRLEAQTVLEGGTLGTAKLTQNFLQEWDHEFEAYHLIADAVKSESSAPTIAPGQFSPDAMESLQIGKTSWVKTKDGWLQFDVQQPQVGRIGGIDLPTNWYSLQPVSEEMVAGIHCTHYTVDENIVDESIPNALLNGVHAQGDLWIASQTGIPSVILRAKLKMSVSKPFFYAFFSLPPDWASPTPKVGEQAQELPGIFHYDYEVKEANLPVRIEPPPPAVPGQQY